MVAPMRRHRTAATLGLAVALAGCVLVPRTAEVYDPQCRTYVKQVVLQEVEIGALGGCRNEGCAVLLASLGVVAVASAVISGSVAIVGNIAYWAERQGQCPPAPPAPAPPP